MAHARHVHIAVVWAITLVCSLVLACRPEPRPITTVEPVALTVNHPDDVSHDEAQASSSPVPAATSLLHCDIEVFALDERIGQERQTLRTSLLHEPSVRFEIVEAKLLTPDCSGVGYEHAVLTSVTDPTWIAYARRPLYGASIPKAVRYGLGGTSEEPRSIDLNGVCVPFEGIVRASARWLVPITDDSHAVALATLVERCRGLPNMCSACSNECGDAIDESCCKTREDGCPGMEDNSTCVGWHPCDSTCCPSVPIEGTASNLPTSR